MRSEKAPDEGVRLCLVLFTKVPRPGFVKTRFAARDGPPTIEDASALYVALLHDTLAAVRELRKRKRVEVVVSFVPAEGEADIRSIVSDYVDDAEFVSQDGANVTERVRGVFLHAFGRGSDAVSLIPGDHPDLDGEVLSESFDRTSAAQVAGNPFVTLGPTMDGGAYLLGFNRQAFDVMNFSLEDTHLVCADIVMSARRIGIPVSFLANRNDIDDWDDARQLLNSPRYDGTRTYSLLSAGHLPHGGSARPEISVIVPALNEEKEIGRALASLEIQNGREFETILVDGVSHDSTIEKAWGKADKIVFVAEPSRKGQENVGAAGARGEVLLFLHADMLLPPDAIDRIARTMADPAVAGGSCRVAFDARGFRYSFLSAFRTCGSRLLRLHGISSAFFVRRSLFLAAGGFREDVMEEAIDLVHRLPGSSFVTLDIAALSSARKFEGRDFFFVAALWSMTVFLTFVGVRRTGLERKLWKSIR